MNRIGFLSLTFALVLLTQQSNSKKGHVKNNAPVISSFVSSSEVLSSCPWSQLADKPEAGLTVNAYDADNDQLAYEYSTTGGRIQGKGRSVIWDLRGVINGTYQVTVRVTDGKGGEAVRDLKVTIVDFGSCDAPPPPCPEISVSCENESKDIKHVVFSVSISKGPETPALFWKVNAGRIPSGQGTNRIEVDASVEATGFDEITADVKVGVDPSCTYKSTCTTRLVH